MRDAALRSYGWLLRLCPPGFRTRWADRMVETVRLRAGELPRGDVAGSAGFWLREYLDVLRTALREWSRVGPRRAAASGPALAVGLGSELRQASRSLVRRPVLTGVIVATAALGIGANALVFSVVHAVLIRPLPLPEPDRLLHATGSFPGSDRAGVSPPDFLDYRQSLSGFESLSATLYQELQIAGGHEPAALVRGAHVSHEFFDTLGVAPASGRGFRAEEERPGRHRVVVVSHGLWQSRFGGRSDVLGATLHVGGEPHAVVGVAPLGFDALQPAEVWKPIQFGVPDTSVRRFHFLRLVGRLAPGFSRAQAQAEVDRVAARLEAAYPESNEGWTLALRPLQGEVVRRVDQPLRALGAAVVLLLLIVCANLAGVLLARSASRRGEVALRAALGASGWRCARLVLVECLLLGGLGGAAGLALAWGGLALMRRGVDPALPRLGEIALDGPVFAFAAGLTLATGLLLGLAPALQASRLDPWGTLGGAPTRSTAGRPRRRLQSALVVAQVTLSLVLLVGAAATSRSLAALQAVHPGFEGENVVTARWTLPEPSHPDPESWRRFYGRLLQRLESLPGSISAAAIDGLPFASSNDTLVHAEGRPPEQPADRIHAQLRRTTPGYFATLAIPLLAGRDFDDRDGDAGSPVAVVSASLAQRAFGTADAVGEHIVADLGEPVVARVVGVVGDVHNFSLASPSDAGLYLPFALRPGPRMSVVVRSGLPPGPALQALRAAGAELAPDLPTSRDTTVAALVASSTATTRWQAIGVGGFAGLAAALAALGLYGVLSQVVQQREREMGVRLALGASPARVRRSVVLEGLALVAAGLVLGLPLAVGVSVLAERHLFGVRAADPAPMVAVVALLLAVGWASSRIPARRAMRVDPSQALRAE